MKLTVQIKNPESGEWWETARFTFPAGAETLTDEDVLHVARKIDPDATAVHITREYSIEKERAG